METKQSVEAIKLRDVKRINIGQLCDKLSTEIEAVQLPFLVLPVDNFSTSLNGNQNLKSYGS